MTGTFDGRTARLYVDGTLKASSSTTAASTITYGGTLQQHGELGVGAYPDAGTCPDYSKFPGQLDEVRIHARALSAAEIAKLHRASATTPPDLTPPGGGGGGGGGPRRPVASFTAPGGRINALTGQAILDARGTRNASALLWDLNGDGRTDLTRSAAQPFLQIRVPRPTRLDVRLTALGPGGVDTIGEPVTFGGTRASADVLKKVDPLVITTTAASPIVWLDAATIFDLACVDSTVTFGLGEAAGCFNRTDDVEDVPARERDVVKAHYQNEIFNKTVNVICTQAAQGKIPQSKCDEARAFFSKRHIDVYVSKGVVKLNGLKITPASGASVVVYPNQERVISSNATLRWGAFKIKTGQIDLDLTSSVRLSGGRGKASPASPPGKASLLYFNPRETFKSVGNFPINGYVELALQGLQNGTRASTGSLHLELPGELSVFGGKPPTADVQLAATNAGGGPDLDNMALRVPEANFGPVRLSDMSFVFQRNGHIDGDYNPGTACDRKEWKVRGNVQLTGPNGGAVYMTPPPPQNGLGFCAGEFKHFGANIDLPQPRPQIFPGVFLDSLNFGVQIHPVLVRGGGGFSAGEIAKVYGELLIANASPQEPYRMGPGEPTRFNALRGRTFTHPTIAVGGDVKMHVPGTDAYLPIGDGAIMYAFPNYMYAGGSTSFVGPGMRFFGEANVSANARTRQFDALVGGKACIAGITRIGPIKVSPCIGGYGRLSSRGIMACMQLSEGELETGAGYHWGDLLPKIWPFSCYPSKIWVTVSDARAAAADKLTFKVARGETLKQVEVDGAGAAPKVVVTGPGGIRVVSQTDGIDRRGPLMTVHQDLGKAVYIGVKNGKPGTYTVTRLPGSVALRRLSASRKGYDSKWTARVTGTGRTRVLRYDARKKGGGQVVRFYEVGSDLRHLIVTSRGGRGAKRFTPSLGSKATRRIVAEATIQDRPIPSRTLARFRPPASRPVGRPGRVTARRRGTALLVTWTRARGAQRYGIKLKGRAQRSRTFTVSAGRRSLRIRRVPLAWAGTVAVSARGDLGRWGRPRSASFARRRAPFTALQTNRRNERLEAKRAAAKRRPRRG